MPVTEFCVKLTNKLLLSVMLRLYHNDDDDVDFDDAFVMCVCVYCYRHLLVIYLC